MKLKLDENLGERGRVILQQAGHDVTTAAGQALMSATDEELIRLCAAEGRALVTLDLDFANPLRFRPSQYAGIAVARRRGTGLMMRQQWRHWPVQVSQPRPSVGQ